jgi:hypothetical protein
MADQTPSRFTGPDTLEALIADRQKMWGGFTSATLGAVAFVVVLLILMAVFLL